MKAEVLPLRLLINAVLRGADISSWLPVTAAAASFIIYTSAVVAMHQHRDNSFGAERVGMAAAVSYVTHRAPFGKVNPSIQKQFLDLQAPTDRVIHEATRLVSPAEDPVSAVNDGNGLGFIVAASWAMRLFGPHLFALPFFMLGLMAIAAATFLCRFGDNRAAVVTVTFFSLTLMLCTPLVSDPLTASRIPIGGIRYFSLVAVVPAFHLVLELADRKGKADGAKALHALLLAVQVILLLFAVLVRGSAAYVAGPILLIGLVKAWRNRDNRGELRSLYRNATVIAIVGAVFLGSLLVALPSRYVRDGSVTTVFWHRAFVSLGINPEWPFGDDLQQIYDCTRDIPEGFVAAPTDRNAACIWWHWARTHNMPAAAAEAKLYSNKYEAVLRAAFFNVVRLYPDKALATFFYYKPKWIVQSILEGLALSPAACSEALKVLLIAGFINFLGFLVIPASFPTGHMMLRLTGLGTLFGISVILSYLIVWATLWTAADLLFYCLFCIGMGLGAMMQLVQAALRRTSAERVRA